MPKTVDILLTKPVFKLGTMGDIVSVRPGYARNYLLPQGMAIPASAAAKRQVEVLREQARQEAMESEARALALKKQIEGLTVRIEAKVAHDDVLFGSVGVRDIAAAVKASKGVELDPRQINLSENFKTIGRYPVTLTLAPAVRAEITVEVVSDNPEGPGLDEQLEATADDQAEA